MDTQKTPNSQSNLKKSKDEGITLPDFRLLQNYGNQNSMVLAQKQKYR